MCIRDRAATLLTISDTLKGEKQSISSADRELALTNMMEIALGLSLIHIWPPAKRA